MALMNSFYGGRRGASFVIVKNYLDVVTMTADFARGNDFTEVNYDEYVMINNPNKNHPDNGKIFRRGYDYNSDRTLSNVTILCDSEGNQYTAGLTEEYYKNLKQGDYFEEGQLLEAHGAEYIGCIVGPAGKAPLLSIGAYEDVEDRQADPLESRRGSGEYRPDGIHPGLIPGKEGNTFHDAIEWCYTSIRNDNYGDATQAFIGFKFPYLVTQMETQMVEPYAPENNYKGKVIAKGNYTDTSEIHKKILTEENGVIKEIFDYQLEENQEEILHPYYNKWHLNIPKGVKGDTLKNLKVTTFNSYQEGNSSADKTAIYRLYKDDNGKWQEEQLLGGNEINYTFFKNHYKFTDEQLKENQEYVPVNLYNLLEDKQILIYEVINYDNKQNGQKKYYYLGDYNQISNINLEDGILAINFTNSPTQKFEVKSIKSIRLGPAEENLNDTGFITEDEETEEQENSIDTLEEGQLEITYTTVKNGENEKEIFQIPWVNEIGYVVNEDTKRVDLVYTVAGNDNSYTIMSNIKNISNITSLENGGIKILYVGGEEQDFPLRTVANIKARRDYYIPKYQTYNGKVIHYAYKKPQIVDGVEQPYSLDPVIVNSQPIIYIDQQDLDGKPVPQLDGDNPVTEKVTGIIVTYINGQEELITDKIDVFNYLQKFEYQEQDGKLTIQQFKDGIQKNFYLNYVNKIFWDENEKQLKYGVTGNPNTSTQVSKTINVPFIQQLDIADNLDLFVRFSNSYYTNGQGEEVRRELVGDQPVWDDTTDTIHKKENGWYYLGNLFRPEVFNNMSLFEVGLTLNLNKLKEEVERLPNESEYDIIKEMAEGITQNTEQVDVFIIEAFNTLFPQGINNRGPSGGLIALGEDNDIKSLYAFTPSLTGGTNSEETISEGGWFFLGSSSSANQFLQVGESATSLAAGGYLLKTTNDICSITINDNNIQLSNCMKMIKTNSPYTTEVFPIQSGTLQILMNQIDVTNEYYENGVVNIPSVTGDISFNING